MNRETLKVVTAALMCLCLMALVSLGFLREYILAPGTEAWVQDGNHVDLAWLGLNHQHWRVVFISVAGLFLGLVAVHLVLHRQMLAALYNKWLAQPWARWLAAPAFGLLAVLLLTLPVLITPARQKSALGPTGIGTGTDSPPTGLLPDSGPRETILKGAHGPTGQAAKSRHPSVSRKKIAPVSVRSGRTARSWHNHRRKARFQAAGSRPRYRIRPYYAAACRFR
uniref:DUF4405 domain-containing protein n=1 Tax=Desulfobacca acetoxidans TaxID=60893 RepID=A0A7C3Z3F7_9BACT